MTLSRYSRAPLLAFGTQLGTSRAIFVVREAVKAGTLTTREVVLKGAQRLDTLAGEIYGDGRLFWVLCAASDIGYALQCPPGTIIKVPNLADVTALLG